MKKIGLEWFNWNNSKILHVLTYIFKINIWLIKEKSEIPRTFHSSSVDSLSNGTTFGTNGYILTFYGAHLCKFGPIKYFEARDDFKLRFLRLKSIKLNQIYQKLIIWN